MSAHITFVTSSKLSRVPGLRHGMTQRFGGVSSGPYKSLNLGLHVYDRKEHVIENRRRVCSALGFSFNSWVGAEQVHGVEIVRVTAHHRGCGAEDTSTAIRQADGLVTNEVDVLLTAFFADCVPLVAYDQPRHSIGLIHAGWRGTLGKIAVELVKTMQREFGSHPSDLYIWIGPSIQSCCYVVDSQLAQRVANEFGNAFLRFDMAKKQYALDLPALNKTLLQQSGVQTEHIERAHQCTHCESDVFFSHRASGGTTGRMACIVGLTK